MQGRWTKPFLIQVPRIELQGRYMDDAQLRARRGEVSLAIEGIDYEWCRVGRARLRVPTLGADPWTRLGDSGAELLASEEFAPKEPACAAEKIEQLGDEAQAFLASITTQPLLTTLERYRTLGFSTYQGNQLKDNLIARGLIRQCVIVTKRGRVVLLELAKQAKSVLGGPQQSLEHRFWVAHAAQLLRDVGFTVHIEEQFNGAIPDVMAERGEQRLIVEVETGKSDFRTNLEQALRAQVSHIYVLATGVAALATLRSSLAAHPLVTIQLAKDFSP